MSIIRCAVFAPLYQEFDYLVEQTERPPLGARVLVPFGKSQRVAVVTAHPETTDVSSQKLKPILQNLDALPLLDAASREFISRVARYYHYPLGDTFATALPSKLRKGEPLTMPEVECWQACSAKEQKPLAANAIKMQTLLTQLQQADITAPDGATRASLKRLAERGLAQCERRKVLPDSSSGGSLRPELTAEQQTVLAEVKLDAGFQRYLLNGVTGSGKTEVYLRLIEQVLAAGKQVLVLVPEIGLTPQLVQRFKARLATTLVSLHSGLNDSERVIAWEFARQALAQLVLGTRSAVFTPLPNLGLVIVDEEHDGSLKQQDGLRYHARDLALMRAQQAAVPCVLGSATPSLETLAAVERGQMQELLLKQRANATKPPLIEVLDIKGMNLRRGVAPQIWSATEQALSAGNQVMWFLNRRGLAPVLMCHQCAWSAECQGCDSRMTLHKGRQGNSLHCHRCATRRPAPQTCPSCNSLDLIQAGMGTEALEDALNAEFAESQVLRIDRDNVRGKKGFDEALDKIHSGAAQLLVGTQMLAKGHHFPNVTLVAIIDADSGLYSTDFRAVENLAQQVLQVAGRAGREGKKGRVLMQTHNPEHPIMEHLQHQDYSAVAKQQLTERKAVLYPPYGHLAYINADARNGKLAADFLTQLSAAVPPDLVEVTGPEPSVYAKLAGRYRWRLQLWAEDRKALHSGISRVVAAVNPRQIKQGLRWSVDVDPYDG